MKASERPFLDLLEDPTIQFVIPIYQREYSWTTEQCATLFRDVRMAGKRNLPHFMGTVLYYPETEKPEGISECLDIVDGQQRMATLMLLLAAFSRWLAAHPDATAGTDGGADADANASTDAGDRPCPDARAIADDLLHAEGAQGKLPRLVLSEADDACFQAALDEREFPAESSVHVEENLAYFAKRMASDAFDPKELWNGFGKLFVIDTRLELGHDNPQLVYEALNSKGMPLTTADMVRNYILIGVPRSEQSRLYRTYWKPTVDLFEDDPGSRKINNSITAYVYTKVPNVRWSEDEGQAYALFKYYREEIFTGTTEELLKSFYDFSKVWAKNFKYHGFGWARSTQKFHELPKTKPQFGQDGKRL